MQNTLSLPPALAPETHAHLLDVMMTLLQRHENRILSIVLFGSVARHEERPFDDPDPSDVDLLIILDTDDPIEGTEYRAFFHSLGLAHQRHLHDPREFSIMLGTRSLREWDPLFVANVAQDGIVLYARSSLPLVFNR